MIIKCGFDIFGISRCSIYSIHHIFNKFKATSDKTERFTSHQSTCSYRHNLQGCPSKAWLRSKRPLRKFYRIEGSLITYIRAIVFCRKVEQRHEELLMATFNCKRLVLIIEKIMPVFYFTQYSYRYYETFSHTHIHQE